jgi:hypothetical protein
MSGKMTELEDKGEVENIGSEHERCEHWRWGKQDWWNWIRASDFKKETVSMNVMDNLFLIFIFFPGVHSASWVQLRSYLKEIVAALG